MTKRTRSFDESISSCNVPRSAISTSMSVVASVVVSVVVSVVDVARSSVSGLGLVWSGSGPCGSGTSTRVAERPWCGEPVADKEAVAESSAASAVAGGRSEVQTSNEGDGSVVADFEEARSSESGESEDVDVSAEDVDVSAEDVDVSAEDVDVSVEDVDVSAAAAAWLSERTTSDERGAVVDDEGGEGDSLARSERESEPLAMSESERAGG